MSDKDEKLKTPLKQRFEVMGQRRKLLHLEKQSECPLCGRSLLGRPIPLHMQKYHDYQLYYKKLIGLIPSPFSTNFCGSEITEWFLPCCKKRVGRWTGDVLKDGEVEQLPSYYRDIARRLQPFVGYFYKKKQSSEFPIKGERCVFVREEYVRPLEPTEAAFIVQREEQGGSR